MFFISIFHIHFFLFDNSTKFRYIATWAMNVNKMRFLLEATRNWKTREEKFLCYISFRFIQACYLYNLTLFFSSADLSLQIFDINFQWSSIVGVFASISELTRIIATINKLNESILNIIRVQYVFNLRISFVM